MEEPGVPRALSGGIEGAQMRARVTIASMPVEHRKCGEMIQRAAGKVGLTRSW